jgi:hypothetical protein
MTKDQIYDLEIAKSEALGYLLGMIDVVVLAYSNPLIFHLGEKIEILRVRRAEYDEAHKALIAARLAASVRP